MVLGQGARDSDQAARMAGHTARDDIWTRDRGVPRSLSTGSGSRWHRHDALGQGAGRDAVGLRPPACAPAAGGAIVDQEDERAVGTLDAAGDALLLLPGKAGESETLGQTTR